MQTGAVGGVIIPNKQTLSKAVCLIYGILGLGRKYVNPQCPLDLRSSHSCHLNHQCSISDGKVTEGSFPYREV